MHQRGECDQNSCFSFISCCSDKDSDKSNSGQERFIIAHSSRLQSISVGKSWCYKLRIDVYITFIIKKQRAINTCLLMYIQLSLLVQFRMPYLVNGATHSGYVFSPQSTLDNPPHTHANRQTQYKRKSHFESLFLSYPTLCQVNKTNHHSI